jgi:hypothetical protein
MLGPRQAPSRELRGYLVAEAQETPVNGDKPVEESASATQSEPKARTGGLSAGARRKKKIVGISMDTVQQERERERPGFRLRLCS